MIVFKTYFIFMVALFVLSLLKINEAVLTENEIRINEENLKKQRDCLTKLATVFTGDNVIDHGKTAIEYISKVSMNKCNIKLYNQTFDDDDVIFGYYTSFDGHLISDDIPTFETVCKLFDEADEEICKNPIVTNEDVKQPFENVNIELCKHMLSRVYGLNKREALDRVFYKLRRISFEKMLDSYNYPDGLSTMSQFLLMRFGEDEQTLDVGDHENDIKQFPDIAFYYWNAILKNFKVNTSNDGNSNVGVVTKPVFCAQKYPLIPEH